MNRRDSIRNVETEAFTDNSFLKTHLFGLSGLIRMLILLNILGLMGIWASTAHAENVGSDLLLLPMEIDAEDSSHQENAPFSAKLLSTKIRSVISGHIIRTTVVQRFKNPSPHWMEGMYYFPLPDDAAVDSMVLLVGERRIVSQIQEKSQAKATYIKAAAAGKRAALLTQYRPNVFSTKVANIEPGEEISVEISFQTLAKQQGSEFTWRMPQAITPRYAPTSVKDEASSPIELASGVNEKAGFSSMGDANPSEFEIVIKQGAKLALFQSPSHQIVGSVDKEENLVVRLADQQVPADRDFILSWQFKQGDVPTGLIFQETVAGETYTLGLVLPPKRESVRNTVPRDVTFIMDVSGSMEGVAINQGKLALMSALSLLQPKDRFDVIVFNDQFFRLFGRSQHASSQNVEHARKFVSQLNANNGTEMYPALKSALGDEKVDGYQRQILFLTDGAVSNEEEMFELVASKLGQARLFTVGLGSAPNGWFMRKSAEFGKGMHIAISDLSSTKTELVSLFSDMAQPRMEQINVGLGITADIYPKIVPDLYGTRPVVFIARHHSAIENPILKGISALGEPIEIQLNSATFEKRGGISKLWANHKIQSLADSLARGMDREIVKSKVLDVALAHQVMSPYTSFVAVDDTPARVKNDFLHKMKIKRNLPAGIAWKKINGPQTASPMAQYAWTGTLVLLLCFFILWIIRDKGMGR